MRARNKLPAQFAKTAPVGKHGDGAGPWLVKRGDGGAQWVQWVQRVSVHGRRREMGLGGYPSLSLADARKIGERWRRVAAEGRDPIKEGEAEKRAARRENIPLAVNTADAFESRKAELKGDGKAGRWRSPLELHVTPPLRDAATTAQSAIIRGLAETYRAFFEAEPENNMQKTWGNYDGPFVGFVRGAFKIAHKLMKDEALTKAIQRKFEVSSRGH